MLPPLRSPGPHYSGLAHNSDLVQRFHGTNHIDFIPQPRPEERAPKSGLLDFGNQKVSKSATADFDARVLRLSKDEGRPQASSCPRPSFETAARRARPPQDEVRGLISPCSSTGRTAHEFMRARAAAGAHCDAAARTCGAASRRASKVTYPRPTR